MFCAFIQPNGAMNTFNSPQANGFQKKIGLELGQVVLSWVKEAVYHTRFKGA